MHIRGGLHHTYICAEHTGNLCNRWVVESSPPLWSNPLVSEMDFIFGLLDSFDSLGFAIGSLLQYPKQFHRFEVVAIHFIWHVVMPFHALSLLYRFYGGFSMVILRRSLGILLTIFVVQYLLYKITCEYFRDTENANADIAWSLFVTPLLFYGPYMCRFHFKTPEMVMREKLQQWEEKKKVAKNN